MLTMSKSLNRFNARRSNTYHYPIQFLYDDEFLQFKQFKMLLNRTPSCCLAQYDIAGAAEIRRGLRVIFDYLVNRL